MKAELRAIQLPDFGGDVEAPEIPQEVYTNRLARTRERMRQGGLNVLVVYADREHSANLMYLTGFDPRFEEAILLIGLHDEEPLLLVGNECFDFAGRARLSLRRQLFQDLSLNGQPRDGSPSLESILQAERVSSGSRVGVAGWKVYGRPDLMDAPAYLIDALREAVGSSGGVSNAAGIFIDEHDGLRIRNEVEQLAAFEHAASKTSEGLRNLMSGLRPGMSEREAVQLLGWDGTPLSCHLMLSSGSRASNGLSSPTDRRIERGDFFTVAFGIWGALNCRAGFVAEDASDLSSDISDYVERLVGPYFEAVVAWYEALHVNQTGGTLHEIVHERLGDPFFGIFLNPGHYIHLDEWVNSPIYEGSTTVLRSGTALQCDIIPATGTRYFTTNIEDGLALADAELRDEFERRYPAAWSRIQARRAFMSQSLGITLHPDVLPFSNIPAYLPPFLLRWDHGMSLV